jgi:pyruvate dehydrogenase (quinone)
VQVRHEEAAAFMACAYAKFTGRLGVCLATSGPGGIHLLNGLYDAKLDGQPVLAITGMPFHDLIGTYTQQDVELDKLFMDVAKYNARVMGPTHVENVAHLACRTALLYRGVSHITFPVDLQEREIDGERSKRNIAGHNADLEPQSARLPNDTDLARAADILNSGKRIVILAAAHSAPAPNCRRQRKRSARPSSSLCLERPQYPTTVRTRPGASACSVRVRRRMRSNHATRS